MWRETRKEYASYQSGRAWGWAPCHSRLVAPHALDMTRTGHHHARTRTNVEENSKGICILPKRQSLRMSPLPFSARRASRLRRDTNWATPRANTHECGGKSKGICILPKRQSLRMSLRPFSTRRGDLTLAQCLTWSSECRNTSPRTQTCQWCGLPRPISGKPQWRLHPGHSRPGCWCRSSWELPPHRCCPLWRSSCHEAFQPERPVCRTSSTCRGELW